MHKRLFCFFSMVIVSNSAYSAEVQKVNHKTGAIYINEGSASGFTKGVKVCFFEGEQKIACGKVTKSIENKAMLAVSKKNFPKIQKGFLASISDGDNKSEIGPTTNAAPSYGMSIGINANFLLVTPASYNNIDYLTPASENTSFWESNGKSSKILIPPGFGLDFELLKLNLGFGFRYGAYSGFSIDTNFDDTQSNLVMITKISGTDIGAYLDYYYTKIWNINFGLGLDYDMTTVKLNATQTDLNDSAVNNEEYSATSSLKVISLHLPFIYKYAFGSFGFDTGLVLILPVYKMGPSQSITTPTSNTTPTTVTDQEQDLSSALAHKKASFSANLMLGVFFQF